MCLQNKIPFLRRMTLLKMMFQFLLVLLCPLCQFTTTLIFYLKQFPSFLTPPFTQCMEQIGQPLLCFTESEIFLLPHTCYPSLPPLPQLFVWVSPPTLSHTPLWSDIFTASFVHSLFCAPVRGNE